MTDKEYEDLCHQVQSGNNPFDNGWDITANTGAPMDSIRAKRIIECQAVAAKEN